MFWRSKVKDNKEQKRFYLLPGMGGRAYRRKQRTILYWAVAAGLFVSAIVGIVLYTLSRQPYR